MRFQIYVNAHCGKIYRLKKRRWVEVGRLRKDGYLTFDLNSKPEYNHRFIYEFMYGKIPSGMCVNHKNHKRDDNRIDNLELVTISQNSQYMKKGKNNKSGCPNISWHAQNKKYVIQFQVDKKNKHFGCYAELNNETIDKRNEIAHKLNTNFTCYFPIVDYFGEIIY